MPAPNSIYLHSHVQHILYQSSTLTPDANITSQLSTTFLFKPVKDLGSKLPHLINHQFPLPVLPFLLAKDT